MSPDTYNALLRRRAEAFAAVETIIHDGFSTVEGSMIRPTQTLLALSMVLQRALRAKSQEGLLALYSKPAFAVDVDDRLHIEVQFSHLSYSQLEALSVAFPLTPGAAAALREEIANDRQGIYP